MGANNGRNIAIIGGGIGGLTAALCFAQTGAHVTVYEQSAKLTEVGAGIQITPNGARVLEALGLADAATASGVQALAVAPTDALSGKSIAQFDLSNQHPPYRFFHRAALIDMLADACAAAQIEVVLGARITAVQPDGGFDVNGVVVSPTLTIGADGLRSIVRPMLNDATKPFFTGQVAWRAIIPNTDVPAIGRIWMAPGRHIVTYPLGAGRLNLVAIQERDDWVDEGWNHRDDPNNLRAAFADVCPELQCLLAQVDQTSLWGLFRHPVASHWYEGSVAILGDAAHPTLPFLAQGANLAIEDAYVLARSCDEAVDLDVGLNTYQTARKSRVSRAIDAANSNARNYHLSGMQRHIAHFGLAMMGNFAPQIFLNRLNWLYDHDVTI